MDLGPEEPRLLLSAHQMAPLANQLEESIEEFRSWGIRVHEMGRLPEAIKILRQIACVGHFPESREALVKVGHAVRNGQEFVEIANVLPSDTLRPIAESLQQAVTGETGTERSSPAQFQSELWVGAMLAQSSLPTAVITGGVGKRPDFVVSNGTLRYPVEVKRPAGTLNAAALVRRASRQLRGEGYHGGSLVVDLSDCLPANMSVQFGSGVPSLSLLDRAFVDLTGDLNREIFDEAAGRIRRGQGHVFALITFVRSTYWNEEDLSQVYLLRKVSSVVFYRGHPRNLRGLRAFALSEAIHRGIIASGHQELGRSEITFS